MLQLNADADAPGTAAAHGAAHGAERADGLGHDADAGGGVDAVAVGAAADVGESDRTKHSSRLEHRALLIANGCAVAALLLSLLAFLGWLLLPPGAAGAVLAMRANTALALVLCSLAALVALRRPHAGREGREGREGRDRDDRLVRVLAGAVAGIGAVTLFQYVADVDLGVDALFAHDGAPEGHAGMGSNAAALFLLFGVGTAALMSPRPRVWFFGHAAILAGTLIAFLAIVGHVFGVRPLYAVAPHTHTAGITALLAFAVGTALVAGTPRRGVAAILTSESGGGFAARRLLPVAVLVPVGTTWLTLLGVRIGLYHVELAIALDVVVCVSSMVAVTLWSAHHLNHLDEMKRRGEAQVRTLSRRLRARAVALAESNEELESFSYSVSHDLRAPIRHISGFVELLDQRAGENLDAQSRHYLRTIAEASARAGRLIDDLLAFSRMGRAPMRRSPVDLARLVDDTWRSLEPDRQGRDVQLTVGALPVVRGDPEMLMLALQNLLSNAIKYTRPRERATVDVNGSVIGSEVVVSVRDNGVGFDMRYVGKLFGVFQRLHPAKSFEGVGIGLANVKRIVQRHGGRVWAEGVTDQGATFSFSLPHGGVGGGHE